MCGHGAWYWERNPLRWAKPQHFECNHVFLEEQKSICPCTSTFIYKNTFTKKYGKNRKSIRISIGYLRKHKNSSTAVKTFLAPYAPGRFDAKWFNDVNNILCSFFQFNEFAVRSTPYRKIHKSMDTQFANVPYNVHLLDDNECVPTKDGQGPKKGFGQTPLFRLCLIFIFVTMMRKDEVFGENIMK